MKESPVDVATLARLANDPVLPLAALFPLEPAEEWRLTATITITYVSPTVAKKDDQTNYVEE